MPPAARRRHCRPASSRRNSRTVPPGCSPDHQRQVAAPLVRRRHRRSACRHVARAVIGHPARARYARRVVSLAAANRCDDPQLCSYRRCRRFTRYRTNLPLQAKIRPPNPDQDSAVMGCHRVVPIIADCPDSAAQTSPSRFTHTRCPTATSSRRNHFGYIRLMRLAPHSLHFVTTSIGCVSTSASSPAPAVTVAIAPCTCFSMAALTPRFVAARYFFSCDFALVPPASGMYCVRLRPCSFFLLHSRRPSSRDAIAPASSPPGPPLRHQPQPRHARARLEAPPTREACVCGQTS